MAYLKLTGDNTAPPFEAFERITAESGRGRYPKRGPAGLHHRLEGIICDDVEGALVFDNPAYTFRTTTASEMSLHGKNMSTHRISSFVRGNVE